MNKLTAIIPTGNEEHNIEAVLKSVDFADEIIVVDSYSTDRTVELAKKHGATVIQRKYDSPAAQKNWAIPHATHNWILILDADERVTLQLKEEIQSILSKDPVENGFWIPRQNYFMGKKINYSGWQNDKVLRLFRKGKALYKEKRVHEEMKAEGKTGRLKNKLDHHTYIGLDHYLAKTYRYSTWGAYDKVSKVKKVTLFHLLVKPLFTFIKMYILKLGILDGKVGFIIAANSATYTFQRSLKIWRIKEGESLQTEF